MVQVQDALLPWHACTRACRFQLIMMILSSCSVIGNMAYLATPACTQV